MPATIQTINLGNLVNDGLGDDLRTAFQKVNANFASLQTSFSITGANAQAVGAKVYKEQLNNLLVFRNLIAGNKITLTENADSIQINCTQPEAFTRIDGNTGSILASNNTALTIQGGSNVTTAVNGQYLTVDTNIDLNTVLLGFDFGTIGNQFTNALQILASAANIDFGTIFQPGPFNINLGTI